ncbi:MAG: hypothetical protein WA188_09600 [Terriglobales bacterium]
MLDALKARDFEIRFESHAAGILEKDFPEALDELERGLSTLQVPITEIIGSGGGEHNFLLVRIGSDWRVADV